MQSDPNTGYFVGRFSDGQSAQTQAVSVRLTALGLEISQQDTTPSAEVAQDSTPTKPPTHLWGYDTLTAANPLTSRSQDVLITTTAQEDANLFVASPEFCRALQQKAPQLGSKKYIWQQAKPMLIAAAVIVALAAILHFSNFSIAGTIASTLPDRLRTTMGDSIVGGLAAEHRQCSTPEGVAALDKITTRLKAAIGRPIDFKVQVLQWQLENAFAVPGERILLTSGLITNAQNADEVAGVLAHEMGHGISRHPETGLVRSIGITAGLQILFGGSSSTLGSLGAAALQLGYSRDAEREADDHALYILNQANITSAGLAGFFRRQKNRRSKIFDTLPGEKEKQSQDNDKTAGANKDKSREANNDATKQRRETFEPASEVANFFSTHPTTKERLRKIDANTRGQTNTTQALSNADWQALQAICGDAK